MSIEKYYFDYMQASDEANAHAIWNHTKLLVDQGKKVSIIYSANNKQARKLHKSYFTRKLDKAISDTSSNQAKLFLHIIEFIKKHNAYNRVHILPIATSKKGGSNSGDNAVSEEMLIRDLSIIRQHLHEGWHVIVLTNPPALQPMRNNQEFLIGGGKSDEFYQNIRLLPYLAGREALSQGKFVEHVLNALYQIHSSVNKTAYTLCLERALDHFIFNSHRMLSNRLPTSRNLHAYFCRALNIPEDAIESIEFSKSYNLRIICKNKDRQSFIITELSPYGAESLNTVKQYILHQERTFKTLEKDDLTISIQAESVFNVLSIYCKIPVHDIADFYAESIAKNCGYNNVQIVPQGIRINGEFFTLAQCVERNKFNRTDQFIEKLKNGLTRQGNIRPNNVCYALQSIMELQRSEILRDFPALNTGERPLPKLLYKIAPIFSIYDEAEYRNFAHITDLISIYTKVHNFIPKNSPNSSADTRITKRIRDMIHYHYLSFIYDAYKLYQRLSVEDIQNKTDIFHAIKNINNQIFNFIHMDINAERDELVRSFKVWLYLEIAVVAYLNADTFLLSPLVNALTVYKNVINLMPSLYPELLNFLISEKNDRELVRLTNVNVHQYGPALPQLGVFRGWLERGSGGDKSELALERVRRCLNPVFDAISTSDTNYADTKLAKTVRNFRCLEDNFYSYEISDASLLSQFFNYAHLHSLTVEIQNSFCSASRILNLTIVNRPNHEILIGILKLKANNLSDNQQLLKLLLSAENKDWALFESLLKYKLLKFNSWNLPYLIDSLQQMNMVDRQRAYNLLDTYLASCRSLLSSDEPSNRIPAQSEVSVNESLNESTEENSDDEGLHPPLSDLDNHNRQSIQIGARPRSERQSPLLPVLERSLHDSLLMEQTNRTVIEELNQRNLERSISQSLSRSEHENPYLTLSSQAYTAAAMPSASPRHLLLGMNRHSMFSNAERHHGNPSPNNDIANILCNAAVRGDTAMLDRFCADGIDITFAFVYQNVRATALHWAVRQNNIDSVFLLLNHGADPNTLDSLGRPVIAWADPSNESLMVDIFENYKLTIQQLRYNNQRI